MQFHFVIDCFILNFKLIKSLSMNIFLGILAFFALVAGVMYVMYRKNIEA